MDFEMIVRLIETANESTLSEIKVVSGDTTVHLKRDAEVPVLPDASRHPPPLSDAQAAPAAADAAEMVTAPIVGTFYRAPSPDTPPFAAEGDRITSGAPLCILESMKVMNELEAEFDLEVVAVLAQNGAMVEYGAPLFEVRRL